jgi:hypothetical protein
MPQLTSRCCSFDVEVMSARKGYCYVCRTVHEHRHLDLRHLRSTLLVRVGERHFINWEQLRCDPEKLKSAREGDFCQTLLTGLIGLCPHSETIYFENRPLQVMTCYQRTSHHIGLDFTVDLCSNLEDNSEVEVPADMADIASLAGTARQSFQEGDILRYLADSVSFARL